MLNPNNIVEDCSKVCFSSLQCIEFWAKYINALSSNSLCSSIDDEYISMLSRNISTPRLKKIHKKLIYGVYKSLRYVFNPYGHNIPFK